MRPDPFTCDIETVKQRYQCRAEKVIAQKIGGQIHQYGRMYTPEPYPEEEMHRIVCRKQQQRQTHYPPGAYIIIKNGLFRCWGQQKIKAEEQHQR